MTVPGRSTRAQMVRELLVNSAEVLTGRLDRLDDAALHLLVHGALDEAAREEATRSAHQLVSLAAFGVAQAAGLALRAEALLEQAGGDPAEQGAILADLSARMRADLEHSLASPAPASDPTGAAAQSDRAVPTDAADILVVEDDSLLVELLERALTGAGWTVSSVATGPAALQALDVPAERRPRLVLLDIDLPALDGFGVLRGLTQRGLLPGLKVLCLTARASVPDVLSVLALGAVDHVAKPFSLPVLLARVATAIGPA